MWTKPSELGGRSSGSVVDSNLAKIRPFGVIPFASVLKKAFRASPPLFSPAHGLWVLHINELTTFGFSCCRSNDSKNTSAFVVVICRPSSHRVPVLLVSVMRIGKIGRDGLIDKGLHASHVRYRVTGEIRPVPMSVEDARVLVR